MTNFNERTNTFLYKNMYPSHFILERMDVSVISERWVETGTDCYIDPTLLLTIAALLPHLGGDFSTGGRWEPQPSVCKLVLTLQVGPHSGLPLYNWLNCRRHQLIFFHNVHLLPLLLPLIYTGASLDWQLGQGSIYNITFFFHFR